MTSPYYPSRSKEIADAFQRLDREQLTPWVFLNAGTPVRATNSRGRSVNYQGVGFDGSPREVFWGGFFWESIEDTIDSQMRSMLLRCKDDKYYDEAALIEVADLLRARVREFLARMAEIDRRLRGKGFPANVELKPVQSEIERFDALIDAHLSAARQQLAHAKPSTWARVQGWALPIITAIIGAIVGALARGWTQ